MLSSEWPNETNEFEHNENVVNSFIHLSFGWLFDPIWFYDASIPRYSKPCTITVHYSANLTPK